MSDSSELEALKASFRGALSTAAALAALEHTVAPDRIEAADLEELARATLANAVAAQALRGLVESMRTRRDGAQKTSP